MMTDRSDLLQRSRDYAKNAYVQGGDKAAFHVSSPIGWINDPNGFSVYKDRVHLFFQHHPYDAQWGPMHWGHVTTQDFVRWELLPEALAPDQPYENGCFSGSAITWQGQQALIYTSNLELPQADRSALAVQQQSLAIGDGVNYTKYEYNPVIRSAQLPEGASTVDFRDPKVWEENGRYYMIVASRAADKYGQCLIYESEDLRQWTFSRVLSHSRFLGKMWECPDYFTLNGRQVLMISAQEMKPDNKGFHGKNGTAVMVGSEEEGTFVPATLQPVDYGWDFYAPQTTLLPDGRRVMIAWMQSWDNNVTPPEQTWTGMMTFPREVRVENGRFYQLPVEEIRRYYANRRYIRSVTDHRSRQLAFGRQLDFTLTIENAQQAVFSMDVAAREYHYTRLTYNAPARKLTIDRRHAGMVGDRFPVQVIPLTEIHDTLRLRVLMDKYSMELFLNDGEQAVTVLLFTEAECQDVVLRAPHPIHYSFECYEIDMDQEAQT